MPDLDIHPHIPGSCKRIKLKFEKKEKKKKACVHYRTS